MLDDPMALVAALRAGGELVVTIKLREPGVPPSTRAAARDGLLSAAEVARRTGMAPSTVTDWIRRGELPSVKVGARKLVPEAAIARLLEGGAA